MERSPAGGAIMVIADDGVGGAHGEPIDRSDVADSSLGNQLMVGYARQLGGALTIDDAEGTVIRVELPAIPFPASAQRTAAGEAAPRD